MLQICERWEQIKRKGAYNIYSNYPHIFEGLANNIHTQKALVFSATILLFRIR